MADKLTREAARDLQPGQELKCHIVKGLQLRAWAAGKTWYVYYRHEGQRRKPKIGDYPALTVEDARDVARDILKRVGRGEDPSGQRITARQAPTVQQLMDVWKKRPEWKSLSERTKYTYENNYRLHIADRLAGHRVADVASTDIQKVLNAFDGASMHNLVRAQLSRMFSLAEHDEVKWRGRLTNPVKYIARKPEERRDVHIAPANMSRVFVALDKLQAVWPYRYAALCVILYSGSRVTELVTARRWQLRGNVITLHQHKTMRTGKPREIRLPSQALSIIGELDDDGSGYIFGADLTRHDVLNTWNTIRKQAAVPQVTLRDFRRTFMSVGVTAGATLDQLGQLAGHQDTETTRRYSWLFSEAADNLAQSIADKMDSFAGKVK